MNIQKSVTTGMVSATALMVGSQVATAQGFEGAYAGIALSMHGGDLPWTGSGDDYVIDDSGVGLFAGYNVRLANGLIAGAELAFHGTIDGDDEDHASEPYQFDNLIDTKFKLGTEFSGSMGQAMVYGFVGLSVGDVFAYDSNYGAASGTNLGIGIEAMVADNLSVGLELIKRNMVGYDEDNEGSQSNHTISLRTSFRF